MQQNLMQMQPMMAGGHNLINITTDHIQQYLDENKSLILKILENQNSGELSECAENQARLQRNLMYLAAIADCQPQPPSLHARFSSNMGMQPGVNYMQQQQQSQQVMPQSLMTARPPLLYPQQQSYLAMQQQQALQSHIGMSSAGAGGIHMVQGEINTGGNGTGAYPDFGRSMTGEGLPSLSRGPSSASKQDVGSVGYLGSQGADKGEALYLKSTKERH